MAEWTQQEIEKLMAEMTKKSMTDPEFRREVLEDANAALEKLAGRALPDGVSLKCIEKDPNYQNTFVLPDLLDEEKLDDESLSQVAGGIGVIGTVSVCGMAIGVGPDALACGVEHCAADACVAKAVFDGSCHWEACAAEAKRVDEKDDCYARACALLAK